MGLISWYRERLASRKAAAMFESAIVVSTDDAGLGVAVADGKQERVLWNEVDRVAIETNDSGPWGADVWWLFEGKNGRCAFPQGATGEDEALKVLPKHFHGFSHEQVIRAMRCTSNARFVCWQRAASQ